MNKTKWLSGKGWYEGSLPSQKKINKCVKQVTKKNFAIGESDSYYGSDPVKKAYKELKSKYEETGLSEEEINKVLVLDVKEQEYFKTSDKPGRVESLSYDSYDYAGTGERITKKAHVYLPNGYEEDDTEIKYDIIYLMHGWTGHAGEFFEYASIKEMLCRYFLKKSPEKKMQ